MSRKCPGGTGLWCFRVGRQVVGGIGRYDSLPVLYPKHIVSIRYTIERICLCVATKTTRIGCGKPMNTSVHDCTHFERFLVRRWMPNTHGSAKSRATSATNRSANSGLPNIPHHVPRRSERSAGPEGSPRAGTTSIETSFVDSFPARSIAVTDATCTPGSNSGSG